MKVNYARVTFRDPDAGGRKKTVFLTGVSRNDVFLTGTEVDRYGMEIVPKRKAGDPHWHNRVRVIALDLIVRDEVRVMDLKYGELVKPEAATPREALG